METVQTLVKDEYGFTDEVIKLMGKKSHESKYWQDAYRFVSKRLYQAYANMDVKERNWLSEISDVLHSEL